MASPFFISAKEPHDHTLQDSFLRQAAAAAHTAGHIFPAYAACEAALESTWGQSRLARQANNLFGQKQSAEPESEIAPCQDSSRSGRTPRSKN